MLTQAENRFVRRENIFLPRLLCIDILKGRGNETSSTGYFSQIRFSARIKKRDGPRRGIDMHLQRARGQHEIMRRLFVEPIRWRRRGNDAQTFRFGNGCAGGESNSHYSWRIDLNFEMAAGKLQIDPIATLFCRDGGGNRRQAQKV